MDSPGGNNSVLALPPISPGTHLIHPLFSVALCSGEEGGLLVVSIFSAVYHIFDDVMLFQARKQTSVSF